MLGLQMWSEEEEDAVEFLHMPPLLSTHPVVPHNPSPRSEGECEIVDHTGVGVDVELAMDGSVRYILGGTAFEWTETSVPTKKAAASKPPAKKRARREEDALFGSSDPNALPLPLPSVVPTARAPKVKANVGSLPSWEGVPAGIRGLLEPEFLVKGFNEDGTAKYKHVAPQPGHGSGFQVQLWNGEKLIRLGTVPDARMGALLVAAAKRDPSLADAHQKAKEWLSKVCTDPAACRSWLVRVDGE